MRIGCSSLLFSTLPLEEACAGIRTLGFGHIDLAVHEGWAHLNPSAVAADPEGSAARARLAAGDLQVLSLNAGRQHPEATVRLAAELGVPVVTLPSARAGTPLQAEAEALAPLVELGRRLGVGVTVETHTDQLTEEVLVAVRLCEEVPGLGLTLDPSHYVSGPNAGREFGAVYPYVRHVHVRDAGRGGWPANHREFGRGQVPWASVLAGLRSVGYDEGIVIEYIDRECREFDAIRSVRAAAHAVAQFWYG
jgi:sugar phosphate isomerase/epimerase